MARLADLARKLAALADVPRGAVAAGAAFARAEIRRAGRDDGPLHKGNAVVADAQQVQDASISITRVYSTKGKFAYGVRNDFLVAWIYGAIQREMAQRLR